MYRILVVDDDRDFLEVIGDMLNYNGFVTYKALSFNEAVKILTKEAIDLIIIDIIIPERDGYELISFVQQEYPDIKIIAISGGGQINKDTYLKVAENMQVNATLAKPFCRDSLLQVIGKLSG